MSTHESLSEPTKNEIRSFMWKVVTLPAIPLSVLLFVGGFFWNDVVKEKSESEALQLAFEKVQELTSETMEAKFKAEEANREAQESAAELEASLKAIKRSKEQASQSQKEADAIMERLRKMENIGKTSESKDLVTAVSAALVKDKLFVDDVLRKANSTAVELQAVVQENAKNIEATKTLVGTVRLPQGKRAQTGGFQKVQTLPVTFNEPFIGIPDIVLSVSGAEIYSNQAGTFFRLAVRNPSANGFDIEISGAYTNSFSNMNVTWVAATHAEQ